jgi:hypothetical protein
LPDALFDACAHLRRIRDRFRRACAGRNTSTTTRRMSVGRRDATRHDLLLV